MLRRCVGIPGETQVGERRVEPAFEVDRMEGVGASEGDCGACREHQRCALLLSGAGELAGKPAAGLLHEEVAVAHERRSLAVA